MAVGDGFTSVFTDTGDNLCLSPSAKLETEKTMTLVPGWVKFLKPLWIMHHRLRRLAAGHFKMEPTSYSLYTKASPNQRVTIQVPKPTAVWWNRL